MSAAAAALLGGLLSVAVPVEIDRMRYMTEVTGEEYRLETAHKAARWIAEHGGNVLYQGHKPGDSARAFAVLARGLAAAAFQPGGVTFAGIHWCTDHVLCVAAREAAARLPAGDAR